MRYAYTNEYGRSKKRKSGKFKKLFVLTLLVVGGIVGYRIFGPSPSERAVDRLQFDASVSLAEQSTISEAVKNQQKSFSGDVPVRVVTALEYSKPSAVLAAFVPVTNFGAVRQDVTKEELAGLTIYTSAEDDTVKTALAETLGVAKESLASPPAELAETDIAFIPVEQLSFNVKLLSLNGAYYLDNFNKGAVFRTAEFSGKGAASLDGLSLNNLSNKDGILKVNMTGVTALTRLMLRKLNSNNNPLYFSEKIGEFLADADITHVSNEVSFLEGCTYHDALFCSDPRFIETLKASGVDLVELTGNHNNDRGAQANAETINLYHSLGWKTYGGGLNTAEAAKPYQADQKGSKVGFLAYNYPDSPTGGAIAGANKAGANSFDFDRIKTEIETTKQQSQYVIVNVQFWECYSYPNGYIEFPECDSPIANQAETFKKLIDLGADMVVGSSAHQPQTYELYQGKPIYYGLGNLYFEQTQWPGTERGIVLTHYFAGGKLLQTKLTPTVYDDDFQTRLMTASETEYLLGRLNRAR